MINKNRQTDSKTDKQSWIDVFARTQKLKSSGDESWKKDVPNFDDAENQPSGDSNGQMGDMARMWDECELWRHNLRHEGVSEDD